jgi:O-antigen/teichoic acid export membrane protein
MKQRRTISQIIINTLTGWGALFVQAAIGLFMVPFLLGQMGKDGYGLIGLLGVVVSLSLVADLGLRNALGRELTEHVSLKDSKASSELLSSALMLYLLMGLLFATIGWILTPWLVQVFKVPEHWHKTAVWSMRIYGSVSVILSFVTPVFGAGLSSNNRFDILNLIGIASGTLSSLLLFVIIPLSGNALFGWITVMLVNQGVTLTLYYIFFRRVNPELHLGLSHLKPSRLRPLFQLGGYMYVLQLTNALAERSDPIVISCYLGPAGVALYQAGARMHALVRPVVLTLAEQAYPLTTRYHVQDMRTAQQRLLIDGTKYTLYLGTIVSLGMVFFAEPFCRLWLESKLGSDYLTAARVMQLWAIASLVNYSGAMHWPVLLGTKKVGFALWLNVPTAIFNILLSIYLVGYTKMGIPGVLVATIISEIVRRPFAVWYTAKISKMRLMEYVNRGYLLPGFYILLILVPGYLLLHGLTISGWVELILVGVCFSAYALLVLAACEWRLLLRLLRGFHSSSFPVRRV